MSFFGVAISTALTALWCSETKTHRGAGIEEKNGGTMVVDDTKKLKQLWELYPYTLISLTSSSSYWEYSEEENKHRIVLS